MASLAADLRTMVRTPLFESHVEALRQAGVERRLAAGTTVWKAGERMTHFYDLLEGEMAAFTLEGDRYGDGATLGPTQFVGEVNFLYDGAALLSFKATSSSGLRTWRTRTSSRRGPAARLWAKG